MNFTKRSVLAVAALIVLSSCASAVYAGDKHHSNSNGRLHGSGHGLFSGRNPARGLGNGHGNGHNRRHRSNRWNTGYGQIHGHGNSGHGNHHGH